MVIVTSTVSVWWLWGGGVLGSVCVCVCVWGGGGGGGVLDEAGYIYVVLQIVLD